MIREAITSLLLGLGGCYAQQNFLAHVHVGEEPSTKIIYLNNYVTKDGGDEFVLCLYGSVTNDTLRINSSYLPPVIKSSPKEVRWLSCPDKFGDDRYVGVIHSHPGMRGVGCYPSKTDINRALGNKRTLVEVILCEDGMRAWDRSELEEINKYYE